MKGNLAGAVVFGAGLVVGIAIGDWVLGRLKTAFPGLPVGR